MEALDEKGVLEGANAFDAVGVQVFGQQRQLFGFALLDGVTPRSIHLKHLVGTGEAEAMTEMETSLTKGV